ncbi:GDSL-like Lipase/Acylhydrolase [Mycobacteroides abscessus subsp. abscessus]|nr:GDSL-like Lipase/Acylhydrolase [Mycobacteroides abscessus subsp. abscessus]
MKLKKSILHTMLIGSLLVSLPMTTLAKENKQVDYVALGDSLAAGATPYRALDKGYVDFLVDRYEQSQYEITVDNYGFPGYKTTNIVNELFDPSNIKYGSLRESIKNAELVTIDIGANDLLANLHNIKQNPSSAPGVLTTIAENLYLILSEIDKINPGIKVYVMGYYNPFPHLPKQEQAALLPLLDALNQTIEKVASANGDEFVPTAKVIKKYETVYVPNPDDIHLSLEGYKAVAKEFWKAIQEE